MTYLIDPKVFYFMDVASGFETFFGTMAIVVTGCFIATLYWAWLSNLEKPPFSKRQMILIPTLCVVLFFMVALIPSKATMTKMLVASQVNLENYEMAKEEIIDLIDYIAEKIGD